MRKSLLVVCLLAACTVDPPPPDVATDPPDFGALESGAFDGRTRVALCDALDEEDRFPLFGSTGFGARRDQVVAAREAGDGSALTALRSTLLDIPEALTLWCFDAEPDGQAVAPEERDHFAIRAMGIPNAKTEAVLKLDAASLLAAVGRFRFTSAPAGGGPRARLSIIDSSPTDGTSMTGRSPVSNFGPLDRDAISGHGSTLANIAAVVACGNGEVPPSAGLTNCAVDIHTRLALGERVGAPMSGGGYALTWSDQGGLIGTVADLANAVTAEVVEYREAGSRDDVRGLVLNLSLGFDKRWVDSGPTNAVRALEDALLTARCNGAVIFAAEGGAITPGAPQDMLAPARWYTTTGVGGTPYSCAGRVFDDGQALWDATTPLVYPVGALDAANTGFPATIVRTGPWARARSFQGPASALLPSWVVPPPVNLGPEEADEYALSVTGTSVSTLLVSTMAGVRWGMGRGGCAEGWPLLSDSPLTSPPSTDPAVLYSADELFHDVVLGCGGTAPSVDPVTTTAPAMLTMGTALRSCAAGVSDACAEPGVAISGAAMPDAGAGPACAVFSGGTGRPGCTMVLARDCGTTSTTSCPATDMYATSAQPWVVSQPPPPFCPACFFDIGSGTFYAEYPPQFSGVSTSSVPGTLVLGTASAGVFTPSAQYLDLDVNRTSTTFIKLPTVGTTTPTAGYLTIFRGTEAQSCPVRVVSQ